MTGFLEKMFSRNISSEKKYINQVSLINKHESSMQALSLEDFPKKTTILKNRLEKGETLDELIPEAFALVREAAVRTLSQRHYDVQLIGGIVMHEGNIAEMRTGEGKTLVATLSAYLNALPEKGVHIVTVNDYLARRDAVWMGQIYSLLGLSVGVINSQQESFLYDSGHKEADEERDVVGSYKIRYEFLRPCTRREAYEADITYGTNSEFGFDYLRDNLARNRESLSQRGHFYTIVDEIDSILIDEARTPLIISTPAEESDEFYKKFAIIAATLEEGPDYASDEKFKGVNLTDQGIEKAEQALGIDNIYTEKGIKYVHHLETAARAKALFHRDKDYVVKDGEVIIVDAFTGRLQPGRRWSEGLHQAIEAKEGVSINKETRTAASITYQNYFRFYDKLSGMTGTAETSKEEFLEVYGLDVVVIPTNKPTKRQDNEDLIFATEKGKFQAIARKVKELNEKGQPVLIGTVAIEKNEHLSSYLKQAGVTHKMLNAKNHEEEAGIIAQAGKKGVVTVATNMAGRGIDIRLGGHPGSEELHDEVKGFGGLFVLGTERHEARRTDDQLRGRSGRQGDPGETQFFVSLEDDLMRVFGSDRIKSIMQTFKFPEDQPIQNKIITNSIRKAQKKIEGFNFDARKHVLAYDNVLNHQRESVYGKRRKLLGSNTEEVKEFLEGFLTEYPQIRESVEKKKKELPEETFYEAVRNISLHVLDLLWMEHIETMDYLRSSVNLRAYGQRDPLVEYKREGLRLFKDLELAFAEQLFSFIEGLKSDVVLKKEEEHKQKLLLEHKSIGQFESAKEEPVKKQNIPESTEEKVGRNDPCPCGSGKKYKKCHGV